MQYIRSLDGLRAVAILMVMGVHYHQRFGGGWMGVQLFFVISGFLITRVLLESKQTATFRRYISKFYIRRALRIFPLYYGYMVLLAIAYAGFHVAPNWARAWPWLLTYTLNFGHMLHVVPIDDWYTHFWSLAVEEQFYLIWPFMVWCLSRASLQWTALVIVLLAPIFRAVLVAHGAQGDQLYFFTLTQIDAFASGAFVATLERGVAKPSRALALLCVISAAVGVLANWSSGPHDALTAMGFPYYMPRFYQYVWGYTLLNACAALAVMSCIEGGLSWLGHPVLTHIGRISYGIYVFHRPIMGVLDRHLASFPVSGWRLGLLSLTLYICISYVAALLSYRYYESRFLRLKESKICTA